MRCCDPASRAPDCPVPATVIVRLAHEDCEVLLPMCIACSIVATSTMPELKVVRRVPQRRRRSA